MPEPTHKSVRNALGVFEAFRRLGFSTHDIFILAGTDARTGEVRLTVKLETQDKTFFVGVGPMPTTEEMTEGYKWWNDKSIDPYLKALPFEGCELFRDGGSTMLVMELKARGFVLPLNTN